MNQTAVFQAVARYPVDPLADVVHCPPAADAKLKRSTATAAQEQNIVLLLRTGPKTTDELRANGCYQVSARIFGLRARGYEIDTELHSGVGADGFFHTRMARYTLVAEPLPLTDKEQEVTQCKP